MADMRPPPVNPMAEGASGDIAGPPMVQVQIAPVGQMAPMPSVAPAAGFVPQGSLAASPMSVAGAMPMQAQYPPADAKPMSLSLQDNNMNMRPGAEIEMSPVSTEAPQRMPQSAKKYAVPSDGHHSRHQSGSSAVIDLPRTRSPSRQVSRSQGGDHHRQQSSKGASPRLSRRQSTSKRGGHHKQMESRDLGVVEDEAPRKHSSFDGPRRRSKEGVQMIKHNPFLTYFLLFANCIFFIAEMALNNWTFEPFSENPLYGPSSSLLLEMGGKDTASIQKGQLWRFGTTMFLHGGVIHLFMNMSVLVRLGKQMEEDYGPWRYGLVYVLSGISGTIMSSIFLPSTTTVGCSGCLFGLIGALFGEFFQNYYLMEGSRCGYLAQLLISAGLGLALGLMPSLDNFAHVGGFVCGVFLGMAVLQVDLGEVSDDHRCAGDFLITVASIFLIIWFFAGVAVLYLGIDANKACGWCKYIDCVQTPWWTCDSTSTSKCTDTDGTEIACPSSTGSSLLQNIAASAVLFIQRPITLSLRATRQAIPCSALDAIQVIGCLGSQASYLLMKKRNARPRQARLEAQ